MEAALGWFGDIFRAMLLMVPRLIIVRATHRGVRFRHGRFVAPIDPGLHIYWPLVTEVEILPVKYSTLDLQQQYLETADGKRVGVSGIVAYEIFDAVKVVCECWDYEDVIRDKALAAVKDVVTTNEYAFFSGDGADDQLTETLHDALSQFGIAVISVQLSDFTEAKMIAVWGLGNS